MIFYGKDTSELATNVKLKRQIADISDITIPLCFLFLQMQKFGMIYDKKMKQLKNNYRSVQKLNGRQVHTNVMPVADSGSANIASLFLVVAALFMYRTL